MSRLTQKRSLKNTIAVIVDGQTEQWYLQSVKMHYRPEALRSIRIEPKLPHHKQIGDLFEMARLTAEEGVAHVILIIDLDEILANQEEFVRFKAFMKKYQSTDDVNSWMHKVTVVINNPCLEYWYLLHFNKTTKFYSTFRDLNPDMQRCLPGYCKKEDYYHNKSGNIFISLGGTVGLAKARLNAGSLFNLENCKEVGCSEMGKIFDFFDTICD